MKASEEEQARADTAADFLKQQTGRRSWATVLVDEALYICHKCQQRFAPTEEAVAHHYGGQCLTGPVK